MTARQKLARKLRFSGYTLEEIGKELNVTKQGARYLLIAGDKYDDVKISTLSSFKKIMKNARK